jgi:hypothetical protein
LLLSASHHEIPKKKKKYQSILDAEYLDFFSKDKRNILFALKFSQPKEIKKIKK